MEKKEEVKKKKNYFISDFLVESSNGCFALAVNCTNTNVGDTVTERTAGCTVTDDVARRVVSATNSIVIVALPTP